MNKFKYLFIFMLLSLVFVSCNSDIPVPEKEKVEQTIPTLISGQEVSFVRSTTVLTTDCEGHDTSVNFYYKEESEEPVDLSLYLEDESGHENAKLLSVSNGFVAGANYKYKAIPNFAMISGDPVSGTQSSWANLCSVASNSATLTALEPGSWTIYVGLPDTSGNIIYEGSVTREVTSATKNTALAMTLYPVSGGTGAVDITVTAPSLSSGGQLVCSYHALGSLDEREVILEQTSHSAGQTITFTKRIAGLASGHYIMSFRFTDTVNSELFGSGETVALRVMSNVTTNITGSILSAGSLVDFTLYYFDADEVQKSTTIKAVAGQTLEQVLTSLSTYIDGYTYETSVYTAAEGSGSAISTSTVISANYSVYAHRKTYTLTWDTNGGSVTVAGTPSGATKAGSVLVAPTLSRTGYHSSATPWLPAVPTNMLTAASTFIAQWEANTYKVRFNSNKPSGASGSITGTMSDQNFTYDGESTALTSNAFSLTGWSFNGWNSQANASGTNYTNEQSVSNLTSENNGIYNLYAKWTANTYDSTFNLNGGNISGSTSNVAKTQTYDSSWVLPTNPDKAGFRFIGWNTTGSGDALSTSRWTYTSSQTFLAIWNEAVYNIVFASDGSTGGAFSSATYSISASQQTRTFTAPTLSGDISWTLNSYTVTGASGGTPTATGSTLTIPANVYGDLTVTPVWSGTVTLNYGGGFDNGSLTVTVGSTFSGLNAITTVPGTDYKIIGWYTTASEAGR